MATQQLICAGECRGARAPPTQARMSAPSLEAWPVPRPCARRTARCQLRRPAPPRQRPFAAANAAANALPASGDGADGNGANALTHPSAASPAPATASTSDAEPTSDPQPDAAGVRAYQRGLLGGMLSFLGPATLIPLGDPLMSMVDTMCIGQFAGTMQLAALGPANLVFSFAQYMFQSLQVATLSLLAGFIRDDRLRRSEETLSTAVLMAATLGLLTTAVLEAFPEAIIAATGVRDPSLLPLSAQYLRLRGLAQPAVLVTMVAQSGLLAQQDSATPAITVALSTAVSMLGSYVFVAGLGWGLAGAAVTTVACQYVGAGALLYALSVRGKLRIRLRPPRGEVVWELLRTMGPLSITYIAKNVSYLCIQTTAATLVTLKLAAHQALFAVWNLLAWVVTPLEQAALTYLPGNSGWRLRAGVGLLVGLGAATGVACGGGVAAIVCAAPHALTSDSAVWPHMQSVVGWAAASMLALGADVVASGVNIAMGDAQYVARSYLVTLAILAAFMAGSRAVGWELAGVWAGVVVFFGVRALQSTGRLLWQFRPGAQEAREAAQPDPAAASADGGRPHAMATRWSVDGSGSGSRSASASVASMDVMPLPEGVAAAMAGAGEAQQHAHRPRQVRHHHSQEQQQQQQPDQQQEQQQQQQRPERPEQRLQQQQQQPTERQA